MGWLILCAALAVAFVVCLYSMLVAASRADRVMEIEEEKLIVPETTPVPAPEEEETAKLIVTYPVPLDQDLQDYIVQTSLENEVSPCVVLALIGVESGYDADCIGDNGNSFGLMQIYKSQHEPRMERLGATELLDPYQNVRVGIDYLAELLDEGHGIEWALSYYNGHGGAECDYSRLVLCNARQIFEGRQVHE